MGKGRGAVFGPSGTGTFTTVQNLVKPFVGAGLLALPNAWMSGGLAATSFLLVLLAFVAGWAIFRLVECSDIVMRTEARQIMQRRLKQESRIAKALASGTNPASIQSPADDENEHELFIHDDSDDAQILQEEWDQVSLPSFADVGACAFGIWGRRVVDACILITQFGACTAYVIFISANLEEVSSEQVGKKIWVLIFFVPLVALAMIRRMDRLAPASVMGNFVYLFTVIVIFSVGFKDYCCIPAKEINWLHYQDLPFVFGTCSFALEGIPLILPVKTRMANQKDFPRLMMIAMLIVSSLYLVFGILGYMFFGDKTQSPVIASLPAGGLTDSVKVSLAISLFFTFGLQIFPIASFLDLKVDEWMGINLEELKTQAIANQNAQASDRDISLKRTPSDVSVVSVYASDQHTELAPAPLDLSPEALIPGLVGRRSLYQILVRIGVVMLVCAVAIVFPDFKLIIALFGSFSNALLAYILPAMFWIRVAASRQIFGYDYFPYDRKGRPLRHPLTFQNNNNASANGPNGVLPINGARNGLAAQDDSLKGRARPATSPSNSSEEASPSQSLLGGTSSTSTSAAKSARNIDVHGRVVSDKEKAKVLWLPFTVAIVGMMSSAVGVVEAMRDIINNF